MISFLSGIVATVGLSYVELEVGGVGMTIHAAPTLLARMHTGEQARITTKLIVREDSLTLYGFASELEREMFDLVQTVSGIGPKLALAILAGLEASALCTAISAGDTAALVRIPGVGKRTAERMVVDLRDKVPALAPGDAPGTATSVSVSGTGELTSALSNLGFTEDEASGAVAAITADDPDLTHPVILRRALQLLGERR